MYSHLKCIQLGHIRYPQIKSSYVELFRIAQQIVIELI